MDAIHDKLKKSLDLLDLAHPALGDVFWQLRYARAALSRGDSKAAAEQLLLGWNIVKAEVDEQHELITACYAELRK